MTSLTVRESEVIAAARAFAAHVTGTFPAYEKHLIGECDGAVLVGFGWVAALVEAARALDEPIGVGEVLAAYRDQRDALRRFFFNANTDLTTDDLMFEWDQKRERYARLVADYAEGIGLSVRKAERALGAHLAALEAMEAAR